MMSFWKPAEGESLNQGDLLPGCAVPILPADIAAGIGPVTIEIKTGDLIVVTQNCDLDNDRAEYASLCPIKTLAEMGKTDPRFGQIDVRESIRAGRREGLHMLAAIEDSANLEGVFIVDFRRVISLPTAYLKKHASVLGPRWRLDSAFLEHFSQAFARFFMRVGLPAAVPSFKPKKGI